MKKLLCFLLCVMFVVLFCITCSAQSVDISLDVEKSGRTSVNVNTFVKSDNLISGGVFAIAFDNSVADFKDVSSDCFEVDAQLNDSKLEVVVASDKSVDTTDGIEVFTVKFSCVTTDCFDISIEAKSLVDENLKSFTPDISKVNYLVDVSSVTAEKTKVSADKETDKKSKTAETSKNTKAKKNTAQSDADEKDASEVTSTQSNGDLDLLRVDTPQRKPLLLIIAVCTMVVVAFVFGIVFRKNFFEKKNKK